jgi:hypothetical protein
LEDVMRDECPNCGASKGEEYDLCYECAESMREYEQEEVVVKFTKVVRETDKAFLVKLGASPISPQKWCPKSVVSIDDEWLLMPRWFADKNGFEYEDEDFWEDRP